MSDIITSAIIGAGASVIGNIISSVVSMSNSGKFEKDKNGNSVLPRPFPCAWCDYEQVCDPMTSNTDGGFGLSFDFSRYPYASANMPFISLVFQFPEVVSLVKHRELSFELMIEEGDFCRIDVEIKNKSGDYGRKPFICNQQKELKSYSIDLQKAVDKKVLSTVKEICFVVKRQYFENDKTPCGKFMVRNILISKG